MGLLVESTAYPATVYRKKAGHIFGGLAAVILFMGVILAAVIRKSRHRMWEIVQDRETDELTGIGNMEYLRQNYGRMVTAGNRILYQMFYFRLNIPDARQRKEQEESEEILRLTAAILLSCAGDADLVARVSDTDFAMLRMSPGGTEWNTWLSSVLTRIHKLFERRGRDKHSAAAGIYRLCQDDMSLDEIILYAAGSARSAARQGKDYEECTKETIRVSEEEGQLLEECRRGFENDEFELYIQFFTDTETGGVAGGEALSRWEHPELGLLSPMQFIPHMEEAGMTKRLDYSALKKACAFLDTLSGNRGNHDFFLVCNFSAGTFFDENFIGCLNETVGAPGFDRRKLVVGIPKEALEQDMAACSRLTDEIRHLGFRVLADSPGGDYSRISGMEENPPDFLRLPGAQTGALESRAGRTLIKAAVEAGHGFGSVILAAGVETEEQFMLLKESGCDLMQGFYLHHPIPEWAARKFLL